MSFLRPPGKSLPCAARGLIIPVTGRPVNCLVVEPSLDTAAFQPLPPLVRSLEAAEIQAKTSLGFRAAILVG